MAAGETGYLVWLLLTEALLGAADRINRLTASETIWSQITTQAVTMTACALALIGCAAVLRRALRGFD